MERRKQFVGREKAGTSRNHGRESEIDAHVIVVVECTPLNGKCRWKGKRICYGSKSF